MRIKSSRSPMPRRVLLVIIVALIGSACSADPKPTAAEVQWQKYEKITDTPEVELDWRTRPDAPEGFTSKDMDTFAKTEVALIEKAISTEVAHKAPDDAADFVLDDLLTATKDDYVSAVRANAYDKQGWQWFVASLYKGELVKPAKVIRVDWETDTQVGKLADNTVARYLSLSLQVFVVYPFGPADDPRNVVVRRMVKLNGYRPNGGPAWWPSLRTDTTPFGNDGCALIADSTLRPFKTAKHIKADHADLKKAWDTKGVAPVAKSTRPDPKEVKKAKAECAAHPNGV